MTSLNAPLVTHRLEAADKTLQEATAVVDDEDSLVAGLTVQHSMAAPQ